MSIDDDIFDVGDCIDTLPKELGAKESFSSVCKYIAYLETENDRLVKENIAMLSVIKIVKNYDKGI